MQEDLVDELLIDDEFLCQCNDFQSIRCSLQFLHEITLKIKNNTKDIDWCHIEQLVFVTESELSNEELFMIHKVREVFTSLKRHVSQRDRKECFVSLKIIINEIMPLNIRSVKRLFDEALDRIKLIPDSNVVTLTYGDTGAGKSTTILFLAGCEMVRENINGLTHISATNYKLPGLDTVVTSPSAKSETKYLNPIIIPPVNRLGKETVIMDTAGIGDTRGPAIDIVNGLTLAMGLRKFKGFKLLVFLPYTNLGARGEGVQRIAHLLSQAIDVEDENNLKSVIYIFTRFPESEINIYAKLEDIFNSRKEDDPTIFDTDIPFGIILSDMLDKCDSTAKFPGAFVLNPLTDKPTSILSAIGKISEISNPEVNFHVTMSEKTRNVIFLQISRTKSCLQSALKCLNLSLILYNIETLQLFDLLIPNDTTINDAISSSRSMITQSLKEGYDKHVKPLKKLIISNSKLCDDDMDELKQYYSFLKTFENFTSLDSYSAHTILDELSHIFQSKFEQFVKDDVTNLKVLLANLQVCQAVDDSLSVLYKKITDSLCVVSTSMATELIATISSRQLNEICQDLQTIYDYHTVFNELMIDGNEIFHTCAEAIINHFWEIVTQIIHSIHRLNKPKLNRFCEQLQIIRNARDSQILNSLLLFHAESASAIISIDDSIDDVSGSHMDSTNSPSTIVEMYEIVIDRLVKVYTDRIRMFESSATLMALNATLDEFQMLRKNIREFESRTITLYFQLDGIMQRLISKIPEDVENMLSQLQSSRSFNYPKLTSFLTNLYKNKDWIESEYPELYERMNSEIEDHILLFCASVKESIRYFDMSIHNPNSVDQALKLINDVERFCAISEFFPNLMEELRRDKSKILDRIMSELNAISTTFSVDEVSAQKTRSDLLRYKQCCDEFDSLHVSIILLHENGFNSLDELIVLKQKYESQLRCEYDRRNIGAAEENVVMLKVILQTCASLKAQKSNTAAKQYVKEQNFQNEVEVSSKLAIVSQEIEDFVAYEAEKRKELDRISQLMIKYKELQKSSIISPQQASLLESNSLTHPILLKTIEDLEAKLKNCSVTSQYCFDRVNINVKYAFDSLVFLSKFESYGYITVSKQALDVKTLLLSFLREYCDWLGRTLSDGINKIWNLSNDVSSVEDSNPATSYVTAISFAIKTLMELNRYDTNYTTQAQEIYDGGIRQLDELQANFTFLMERNYSNSNIPELKNLIKLAFDLSYVDKFLSGDKNFKYLHNKYLSTLQSAVNDHYKEIFRCLTEKSYELLPNLLSGFETELPPDQRNRISHCICTSVRRIMKDLCKLLISLKNHLHLDQSKSLIDELKMGIDQLGIFQSRSVNPFIQDSTSNLSSEFERFVVEFKSLSDETIQKAIYNAKTYLKQYNFIEALQAHHVISIFVSELKDFCTGKHREDLMTLQNNIDSSICEDKIFIFSQFALDSPKAYIEKLKRVSIHVPKAADVAEVTLGRIRMIVDNELKMIETEEICNRQHKIATIKHMLIFVPDEIAAQCLIQLAQLEERFSQIEDIENMLVDECKKAIEAENVQLAFEKFNELQSKSTSKANQVSSYISRHLHTKFKSLKQCNLSNAAMFLPLGELHEYSKNFDTEHSISSIYIDAIEYLKKIFESSLKVLANSQTQDVSTVQRHLKVVTQFVTHVNEKHHDILCEFKLIDEFDSTLRSLSDHIISLSTFEYDDLTTLDVNRLFSWFKTIESWNDVVESLNSQVLSNAIIESLLKSDVPRYRNTKSALEYVCGIVDNVTEKLSKTRIAIEDDDIITENVICSSLTLISKISNLHSKFNTLIKSIFPTRNPIGLEEIITQFVDDFKSIGEQLTINAKRVVETPEESSFKSFSKYYKPIMIFMKHNRNIIRDPSIVTFSKIAEEIIMAKIYNLKEEINKCSKSKLDIAEISNDLISIKIYSRNLYMFTSVINAIIDAILTQLSKQLNSQESTILISELEKHEIGNEIISEHSDLAAVDLRNKRAVMQEQDNINYVLEKLEGIEIDTKAIRISYEQYLEKYNRYLGIVLKATNKCRPDETPDMNELMTKIADCAKTKAVQFCTKTKKIKIVWKSHVGSNLNLPKLVALISAIITSLKSPKSRNSDASNDNCLLRPHAAQIVTIFRMLGVGYTPIEKEETVTKTMDAFIHNIFSVAKVDGLNNNLVEVKTGEGKSLILAIVASVFAIYGIDVDISCYSEYLSKRDREDYECLFRALKIESRITYGTFNRLCENLLNERVNVRDVMSDMIKNNKKITSIAPIPITPKILLIDEVDVFISDKFFGAKYYPSFILNDSSLFALQKEMWSARKTVMKFTTVKQITDLASFKACQAKFSNYETLLIEAAKDMVSALSTFEKFSSKHIVVEDILKCVQSDSVIEGANYGYNTLWNYFLENDKGNISEKSLQDNTGVIIDCGTISFAEMPHQFTYISGVTGTLKTLANAEKSILKDIYGIAHFTYMPSVFGKCNREFEKSYQVVVVDKENYFLRLRTEIDNFRAMERPVLVFFESEAKMLEFYKSTNLSDIHTTVNTITERHSEDERNLLVKQATSAGRVTLLPRVFGRGTDFICRSKAVLSAGGVHVIQTFFSPEKSEEIQIQGRCARQGSLGSYCQILLDSDLEWILGCEWSEQLASIRSRIYDSLDTLRIKQYETSCMSKSCCIQINKIYHANTLVFMLALASNDLTTAMNFIISQNKGAELVNKRSRTLILLDATGSMSSMLAMAKDTICTVFARVFDILKKQGLDPDNFLVQFAVYRDYDCGLEGVLQMSNWESKPEQLEKFMDSSNVEAEGGDDYAEAIEIGLLHAVREAQSGGLTQVIVIGDAPAKEFDVIKAYREKYGGGESAWGKKFGPPTHYSDQLKILMDKKVAVHSFYLSNGARKCFKDIGKKGKCEYLDLNSERGGVDQFLNFVTQEILRKSAGDKGEEAVLLYEKNYIRHTK